jgi:hypothetical protein
MYVLWILRMIPYISFDSCLKLPWKNNMVVYKHELGTEHIEGTWKVSLHKYVWVKKAGIYEHICKP